MLITYHSVSDSCIIVEEKQNKSKQNHKTRGRKKTGIRNNTGVSVKKKKKLMVMYSNFLHSINHQSKAQHCENHQ